MIHNTSTTISRAYDRIPTTATALDEPHDCRAASAVNERLAVITDELEVLSHYENCIIGANGNGSHD